MKQFRVYLRALEPDDYKVSVNWRKDDEIWKQLVGPKYFVSEAYEKKWVEDKILNTQKQLVLAVCLKENDQYIGNAYINNIDWVNRTASTGRLIGEKEYWGKGIGKEITLLILYHAFINMGLQRIESRQLTSNLPSIKSLEKCGYKNEGILRKAVFKNGEFQDLNIMSVLREDFEELLKKHFS